VQFNPHLRDAARYKSAGENRDARSRLRRAFLSSFFEELQIRRRAIHLHLETEKCYSTAIRSLSRFPISLG
jgi:hypothetical protein